MTTITTTEPTTAQVDDFEFDEAPNPYATESLRQLAEARDYLAGLSPVPTVDELFDPLVDAFWALFELRERTEVVTVLVERSEFHEVSDDEKAAGPAILALHHALTDALAAHLSGWVIEGRRDVAATVRIVIGALLDTEHLNTVLRSAERVRGGSA